MKRKIWIITAVAFAITAALVFVGTNYYSVVADVRENFADVDRTDQYEYGKTLFETRGCVFCHTLTDAGAEGDAGPNLDGLGARFDGEAIRTSIVDPNAAIATDCPEGPCEPDIMPNFGEILDEEQVAALVVYLSEQK